MELTKAEVNLKEFFLRLLKKIIGLGVSGGVYYSLYLIICKAHNVILAIVYKSIAEVGQFEGYFVISLLFNTYREVFKKLWNLGMSVSIVLA